MTFLAPAYLVAALAAAVAMGVLHLISTRRATAAPLPTIRFVPGIAVDATERALRPTHLLLLALRLLLVLALGLALAAPIVERRARGLVRIVAADVSRAAGGLAGVRDSVRAWERPGDVVLLYDSATRPLVADSTSPVGAPSAARHGALSGALLGALREASARRATADSFELVLVAPLRAGALDAATMTLRAQWPGRVRLVPVAGAIPAPGAPATAPAWAGTDRPPRAVRRAEPDTSGALVVDGDVVVAPFLRHWEYPADSVRGAVVLARWVDGLPAALEWPASTGCARSTVIAPDTVGDLVLRPEFARLVRHLSAACDAPPAGADEPIPSPTLASLAGPAHAAAATDFPRPARTRSPWTPWLLALAGALALAELAVRRRGTR